MSRRDSPLQYDETIDYNGPGTEENDDDDDEALVYVKGFQKHDSRTCSKAKREMTQSSRSWMLIKKM